MENKLLLAVKKGNLEQVKDLIPQVEMTPQFKKKLLDSIFYIEYFDEDDTSYNNIGKVIHEIIKLILKYGNYGFSDIKNISENSLERSPERYYHLEYLLLSENEQLAVDTVKSRDLKRMKMVLRNIDNFTPIFKSQLFMKLINNKNYLGKKNLEIIKYISEKGKFNERDIHKLFENQYMTSNMKQLKEYMLANLYNPKKALHEKYKNVILEKKKKTLADNVFHYKWQELCNPKTGMKISLDDLFNFAFESVLLLLDFTGENPITKSHDEKGIKKELNDRYKNSENPKRKMCADLGYLLTKYKEYLIPLKEMCSNDLLVEDTLDDVPFGQLITFKQRGQYYCMTVNDLEGIMNSGGKNPWTREDIPKNIIEKMNWRKQFINWVVKNTEYEDYLLEQRAPYSELWSKLKYPISENEYNDKDNDEIKEMYEIFRENANMENSDIFSIYENEPNKHLGLVKLFNKYIGDRLSRDFNTRALFVEEIMKGTYEN